MPHQPDQLIGLKFGRLTVIELAGRERYYQKKIWKCKCDCGNVVNVLGYSLKTGNTKSCGCLRKEFASVLYKSNKKHNAK